MIGEPHWKIPKTLVALQQSNTESMEARVRKNTYSHMNHTNPSPINTTNNSTMRMKGDREYQRSFSNGGTSSSGKKTTRWSYFSIESLFLLFCLTASLLILPLILPPLPPPPFLLLLLPIAILGLLMILAFMPSNVRDLTYTYM